MSNDAASFNTGNNNKTLNPEDLNLGGGSPSTERVPSDYDFDLDEIMATFSASANTTAEIGEFIKGLDTNCNKRLEMSKIRTEEKILFEQVSCETLCVYMASYKGVGVLLGYAETHLPVTEEDVDKRDSRRAPSPASDILAEIGEEINAEGEIDIRGTRIITPLSDIPNLTDYTGKMSMYITGLLLVEVYPGAFDLTLPKLETKDWVVFDTRSNYSFVQKVFEDHYPDSTFPTIGCGLVVMSRPTRDSGGSARSRKTPRLLFAIASQTTFSRVIERRGRGADDMFDPTTNVVATVMPNPSLEVQLLAFALMYQYAVDKEGWRDEFSRFGDDEAPNLASLVASEDGYPEIAKTERELERFIGDHITNDHYFGVDIVDGGVRVPGIDSLLDGAAMSTPRSDDPGEIRLAAASLTGLDPMDFDIPISEPENRQILGIFANGKDFRCTSYFTQVAQDPENMQDYFDLLEWEDDEGYLYTRLKEFWPNVELTPLWLLSRVPINPKFLAMIADETADALNIDFSSETRRGRKFKVDRAFGNRAHGRAYGSSGSSPSRRVRRFRSGR